MRCPATDEEALKRICELVKEDKIDEAIDYCRWAMNWCGRGLHGVDWALYFLKHDPAYKKEHFLNDWCKKFEQKPTRPKPPEQELPIVTGLVYFDIDKSVVKSGEKIHVYITPVYLDRVYGSPKGEYSVDLVLYANNKIIWKHRFSTGWSVALPLTITEPTTLELKAIPNNCKLYDFRIHPTNKYFINVTEIEPYIRITNLKVKPTTVFVGEAVNVTANIVSNIDISGKAYVLVDGTTGYEAKGIILKANQPYTYIANLKLFRVGTHSIRVCFESNSKKVCTNPITITVKESPTPPTPPPSPSPEPTPPSTRVLLPLAISLGIVGLGVVLMKR